MMQAVLMCGSLAFSQQPRISDIAAFTAPKGWRSEETTLLGEPLVAFSSGGLRISLELFGGKDSRHETEKAFLESFEARGDDDKPAASLGKVKVYGLKVQAYARRYSMSGRGRDPEDRARPEVLDQQFVVLPAGGRFLVVSWTRGALPDMAGAPATEKLQPEFARFLKGVRIRRSPR